MKISFGCLLIVLNHTLVEILNVANMSLNTIFENKILAQITGFTVIGTSEVLLI